MVDDGDVVVVLGSTVVVVVLGGWVVTVVDVVGTSAGGSGAAG